MRIWCALLLLASLAQADFLLKDGDRVVFLGDSITERGPYPRYVQQYIYCRYPDLNIRFFNAGWSGDTAKGALGRLERDVFSLNPTVVTLCFGMNDGFQRPPNKKIAGAFRVNLEALVKKLKAQKIRVFVFSPTCVDPDPRPKNNNLPRYNETLQEFARIAGDVARKYGCPYVNLFKPMLGYQQSRKAEDPKWTMIPDAVHPNQYGNLVMARWMLVAFKADPMPPLGTMNVGKGAGKGLKLVSKDDRRVVLQTEAPVPVAFWYSRGARETVERCGFADFYVGHKLEVRGLARGDYYLTIHGIDCGRVKSTDLLRGLPVSGFDPRPGKRVHALIGLKAKEYHRAWRGVRMELAHLEGVEATLDGLMRAVDGYHEMVRKQARKQAPVQIVLTRVPTGPNLALRAKYQASDPHPNKQSAAGLTDGSWVPDQTRCFSTQAGQRFPKHVLIDLGVRRSLACIRLGVPPYGSTRAVTIEISKKAVRFKKVAEYSFDQHRTQRVALWFKPTDGRFIKLTYLDFHEDQVGVSPWHMLTTELEAYEK